MVELAIFTSDLISDLASDITAKVELTGKDELASSKDELTTGKDEFNAKASHDLSFSSRATQIPPRLA